MFCPNCGAQIPDDSIFCDKCGCRIGGEISEQQYPGDTTSFPDERKSGGSKAAKYTAIGLIIAAVAGAGVFCLWKTGMLGSGAAPEAAEATAEPEATLEAPVTTTEPVAAPEATVAVKEPVAAAEPATAPEAPVSAEEPVAESGTLPEITTAPAPTDPLPYSDTLGVPAATDFAWIPDVQTGDLTGRFLGNDELVGKWKGEIIYDAGIWELVYITIGMDGKITIEPYKINYGESWDDETDSEPYLFEGEFDVSGINAAGNYGSVSLYTFLESFETQYGVGTFTVNNSDTAKVYMVRP